MSEDYGIKTYGKTEQERIQEEDDLLFPKFTYEHAKYLYDKILDKMVSTTKPMGVEIVLNGIPVYTHYQYGTTKKTIAWIEGKRKTVEYFGQSSASIDIQAHKMGVEVFCARFGIDPHEYKLCGGAFPIIVKDLGIVGTVSVSGLTRKEDHQTCIEALKQVHIY